MGEDTDRDTRKQSPRDEPAIVMSQDRLCSCRQFMLMFVCVYVCKCMYVCM